MQGLFFTYFPSVSSNSRFLSYDALFGYSTFLSILYELPEIDQKSFLFKNKLGDQDWHIYTM